MISRKYLSAAILGRPPAATLCSIICSVPINRYVWSKAWLIGSVIYQKCIPRRDPEIGDQIYTGETRMQCGWRTGSWCVYNVWVLSAFGRGLLPRVLAIIVLYIFFKVLLALFEFNRRQWDWYRFRYTPIPYPRTLKSYPSSQKWSLYMSTYL